MNYSASHEQGTAKRNLPLIVVDTSVFFNWASMQYIHDHEMPPKSNMQDVQSMKQLVEAATDGNRRTLVITRQNLIEMLSTATGRLDLEKLPDGTLRLPEGFHPNHFAVKHNRGFGGTIYQLLQNYQQKHMLRCYGSTQEMFEAGEATYPKGGIVIVDTEKNLPFLPNGRRDNNRLDPYYQHTKDMQLEEQAQEAAAKNGTAPTLAPSTPRRPRQYADRGDHCITDLCRDIIDYRWNKGLVSQFYVLSDDIKLNETLWNVAKTHGLRNSAWPKIASSTETLWALSQGIASNKQFNHESAVAYFDASLQERQERGLPNPLDNPTYIHRVKAKVEMMKMWLDATSHPNASWAQRQ